MTSTSTEPALPVVFRVSEWGRSERSSQEPEPRGTWIMFSFGDTDRLLDGRADLVVSTLGVADEPVAVADRDDAAKLHASSGVGHPLDHVDVQYFVFQSGRAGR